MAILAVIGTLQNLAGILDDYKKATLVSRIESVKSTSHDITFETFRELTHNQFRIAIWQRDIAISLPATVHISHTFSNYRALQR